MAQVVVTSGIVELDTRIVRRADRPLIRLTPRERDLLAYLAERPDRVVSRETLLQEVWGYAPNVVSRAIDKTMVGLRTKVEVDPSEPRHLLTEHGAGYRFRPLATSERGAPAKVAEALIAVAGGARRVSVVGLPGSDRQSLRDAIRAAVDEASVSHPVEVVASLEPRRVADEVVVRCPPLEPAEAEAFLGARLPEASAIPADVLSEIAEAVDGLPELLSHAARLLSLVSVQTLRSDPAVLDPQAWRRALDADLAGLSKTAIAIVQVLGDLCHGAEAGEIAEILDQPLLEVLGPLARLEQSGLLLGVSSGGRLRLPNSVHRHLRRRRGPDSRVRRWLADRVRELVDAPDGPRVVEVHEWFAGAWDDLARHAAPDTAQGEGVAGAAGAGPDEPMSDEPMSDEPMSDEPIWCALGAAVASRLAGQPVPPRLRPSWRRRRSRAPRSSPRGARPQLHGAR